MSIDTQMRNEFSEYDQERIKKLEAERDSLKAEVIRLSGKTGFCAQCEAKAREIDSLLQTLAKERDEFGKRETELIKERKALKAELEKANKLKELNDWYERFNQECLRADTLQEDRDRWRGVAENMAEDLRRIRDSCIVREQNQEPTSSDYREIWRICVKLANEALKEFDEAFGKPQHGPGTGCKCTSARRQ